MITRLDDAFRFHEVALNLRSERQQVLASNIANASTPNYKARDIDFAPALQQALAGRGAGGVLLATTAAAHLRGDATGSPDSPSLQYRTPAQGSIDGNTVEMDAERAQFVQNSVHIETGLTVLSMQIKQMLSAIQG
ncbi:MAG TPA: flagellar basal body rod protein FlgB [Burkholderiales bacterium]|nr:flagellar basal body rod protein FlgB [Burkholderiales bacterium]